MAGQTFTTYINAKRTGSVDAEFAQLSNAAAKSLTGIQQKADAASRSIAGLTGGRGTAGRSPITQGYLNSFDEAKLKADRLEAAQQRLARSNSTLVRTLRTTGDTLQVVQGPLGPIAGRVTAAADALTRLTGVTLGLAGAGAALFAYVRAANHFVDIRNKLAPLYDTQEQVNQALERVYGIAQRARSGLEPIAELYGKLKLAADQYGISQDRVAHITELAAKSATLSGGPQVNRERGLYQFTQAIGTGKLQGQDLRALLEDTPFLGREISVGLSKLPDFKGQANGSIGSLRKLAEEGKITADVIVRALEAAAGDIETRFSRMPPTIGSAFQNLGTSATAFVGKFEEATHIVGNLASGILLLSNNLPQVIALAGGVAAGFAAIAAAGKFKDISRDIGTWVTGLRAQQVQAQTQLSLATRLQASTAARTVALREEQAQIQKNVAALEAEVVAQRQLAEQGRAVGFMPGAGGQVAAAEQAGLNASMKLAAERERLNATTQNVIASETRLATAHSSVEKATASVAKSSSLLKSGLSSLLGAINPVGIAVGIATSLFLEWAFAESEAEKAAKKVEDAQRQLATVIDFTTGKVREQNNVLLANAKLAAEGGIGAAQGQHVAARQGLRDLADSLTHTIKSTDLGVVSVDRTPSAGEQKVIAAIGELNRGGSVQSLLATVQGLAKADPSLRGLADRVTVLAGDAQTAARQVGTLQSSLKIIAGTATAEDIRRASGDFSGGRAEGETPNRNLAAEAEVLRKKLQDQRFAAETQMNESLENLEKRRSTITADDYVRERAQIEATYDTAIKNIDKRETAEETRRQRAHEREMKRIEEENKKREERTSKRTDILGRYQDEPSAVIKAQKDIRDLNALVGQTMNGIAAITSANPLGQGIYTKDMADRDAQNIADGLERPFAEYMRQRERDVQVSALIASGHDLEAQALQKAFDLYDRIGHVSMQQYDIILGNLRAEEQTNDALAARDRILAPLRQSAENVRNSIVSAIEAIESGANPLKTGQSLIKSVFQQFNQASAAQLAEKITGGLDARVRDLIRGTTSVDTQIANYLDALNRSAGGAEGLTSALDKAAAAASGAAEALDRISSLPTAGGAGAGAPGGDAGALYSLLGASLPSSFYKSGVNVGGGVGDNIIYKAIGGLGAVITENLRSQSVQNALFNAGKTTARISDHTTSDEAYDVRLPHGMDFATATALIKKTANEFGYQVIKAIDETGSGGTGPHAHYVFGGSGQAAVTGAGPIGQVAGAVGDVIGGKPASVIVQSIKTVGMLADNFIKAGGSTAGKASTIDPETGAIVVTGTRPGSSLNIGGGANVEKTYNAIGQQLGSKLDKVFGTKFLAGIGSKLGTALSGAQTGAMVASVGKMIWGKFSSTGAEIGGAIGKFIPIPGGDIIGAIIGGTIGGLLTKTKKAVATITGSGGVLNVGAAQGYGGQQLTAAKGLSTSVGDTLQQIADTLHATIGNFAVSIGVDKKGKYVVDPSGGGRTKGSGTMTFTDQAEAIQAALMDAIKDGAIAGISAASQTILRRATDLQKALNKVVVIESIPRRLLALTNPVKAAIMDLNDEFSQMISYLKEGGATADQYAQAQKLYDLERQKAIEQAANGAGSQIQDYLNEMLGGQNSPLNKATVYQNAQSTLQPFITDINSGKAVDSDAFLKAVQNFQNASQELNGSSSSFFDDFNSLVALLGKAKDNIVGSTATDAGSLPASPFDSSDIQAIINGTTGTIDAINNQTNILGGLLQQLIGNILGGGGAVNGGTSAIDYLPGKYYQDTGVGGQIQ